MTILVFYHGHGLNPAWAIDTMAPLAEEYGATLVCPPAAKLIRDFVPANPSQDIPYSPVQLQHSSVKRQWNAGHNLRVDFLYPSVIADYQKAAQHQLKLFQQLPDRIREIAPGERLVLVGHSAGATMLRAMLYEAAQEITHHPDIWRSQTSVVFINGAAAISDNEQWPVLRPEQRPDIHCVHSSLDKIIPIANGRILADSLEKSGLPVKRHEAAVGSAKASYHDITDFALGHVKQRLASPPAPSFT